MREKGKTYSVLIRFVLLLICLAAGFACGCPIYGFFGIVCPCCGVTRAWIAFLSGRILVAFQYHALFMVIPLVGLLYVSRDRVPEEWHGWLDILLCLSAAALFFYAALRWCGVVDMP